MQDTFQKIGLVVLGSLATALWLWGIARYESTLRREVDQEKNAYESLFLLFELYSLLSVSPGPGVALTPEMSLRLSRERAQVVNRLNTLAAVLSNSKFARISAVIRELDPSSIESIVKARDQINEIVRA